MKRSIATVVIFGRRITRNGGECVAQETQVSAAQADITGLAIGSGSYQPKRLRP
jgi:hypothetical protein